MESKSTRRSALDRGTHHCGWSWQGQDCRHQELNLGPENHVLPFVYLLPKEEISPAFLQLSSIQITTLVECDLMGLILFRTTTWGI